MAYNYNFNNGESKGVERTKSWVRNWWKSYWLEAWHRHMRVGTYTTPLAVLHHFFDTSLLTTLTFRLSSFLFFPCPRPQGYVWKCIWIFGTLFNVSLSFYGCIQRNNFTFVSLFYFRKRSQSRLRVLSRWNLSCVSFLFSSPQSSIENTYYVKSVLCVFLVYKTYGFGSWIMTLLNFFFL